MLRSRLRRGLAVASPAVLVVVVAGAACAPKLEPVRSIPPSSTVGEQIYGVICDRVGAQALREDLEGASFEPMCHRAPGGSWASKVDQTKLPPLDPAARDVNGAPVSIAQQTADRAHAVGRIEALARDRSQLIVALDATIPAIQVPIKDIQSSDPTQSCSAGPNGGQDKLSSQLSDLLGRMQALYNDGTIPRSTESLGRLMQSFAQAGQARTAYTHFDAREGYRPIDLALGAARPVVAYAQLRDFANATLSLISGDSKPYAPNPTLGANGKPIPVPGAAYGQFSTLLAAGYQEMRTYAGDAASAPLGPVVVDMVGRNVLTRPRTDLEFLQQLFYAQDTSFGGGNSRYIVQRDGRGYAGVSLVNGQVPAPFVDANGDGLPDVNALGQFLTAGGQPAPTPFATANPDASARDTFGRALNGQALIYDYIDTSHTYAASLMADTKPLLNPDPMQSHETLMNALAGAYVLFGSRDGKPMTTKQYPPDPSLVAAWQLANAGPAPPGLGTTPVQLPYDAFHASDAPMLDLIDALGQLLGDPSIDDTLQLTKSLVTTNTSTVARLTGDALQIKAIADSHPQAHIPATSTFWDEMLDVTVQIEQEPGLLEDVIRALGNDATPTLGQIFSNYSNYNDQIGYDRSNVNGPAFNLTTNSTAPMQTPVDRTMPDVGANRSAFQRFLQTIHDTNGLTVCNKDMATVHAVLGPLAVSLPLGGTFGECGVFKIDNAAKFYLDSIVGHATLWIRDDFMRNGINVPLVGNLGAATVGLMQNSSGINGFWDSTSSTTLRPTPQFLDRQIFFDLANDSPSSGDPNYLTNHFLSDLQGLDTIGSSVCPERIIADPCAPGNGNSCTAQAYTTDSTGASAPDFGSSLPDGNVHGLRTCTDSDSLYQRNPNTIFTWEDFNFYQGMTPLLGAFVTHKREDLFLALMETMHRHWADASGSPDECLLSSDPNAKFKTCTQDGLVTYEPLLVQAFATDLLPALHDLEQELEKTTVSHCDAVDPTTHQCTQAHNLDGVAVLAEATRALLDPKQAGAVGLLDRHGGVTGLRNDGSTNPQVTPIYLLLEALDNIDEGFAAYAMGSPQNTSRQTLWRSARSQLVDQFLGVTGTGASSQFTDTSFPAITPILVDTLRAQIFANCPTTFAAPNPPCTWARTTLTQNVANVVGGPLFAGAMDLTEAIRTNDPARTGAEQLLTYLLDTASQNDALAGMLASTDDVIQIMTDDTNMVPFLNVLATSMAPSVTDAQGNIVQKGMVDAQMSLLSRITGKAYAADGMTERCSTELDPNQVLVLALQNMVTPMPASSGTSAGPGQTPLEVILDTIGDVNRAAPDQAVKLDPDDYESIAYNVLDFLVNKETGLEQFYEIVRLETANATANE
jgi:hypothetical protein